MDPKERKKLRERMMSGILGLGNSIYQGNPMLQAIGDPIRDVYRNYDFEMQGGLPQAVMSKQHPLTIEINKGVPRFRPQPGRGGAPSELYGVPQRVRGLGTGPEAYKPAGPRGGQLTGPMSDNPLVPARQTPMKEEEDEYGFLDAMFLANLVAGMQGGPPPTPYGTAVGGGNKTWASLPTLMRMS